MLAREIERLDAVAGLTVCVAMRLEEIVEELHVELVVLHDQNCLRPSAAAPPFPTSALSRDPRRQMHALRHDRFKQAQFVTKRQIVTERNAAYPTAPRRPQKRLAIQALSFLAGDPERLGRSWP